MKYKVYVCDRCGKKEKVPDYYPDKGGFFKHLLCEECNDVYHAVLEETKSYDVADKWIETGVIDDKQ